MKAATLWTRIKICGLTTLPDALAAAEAGADFLGFVLYPGSPRHIPPERVAPITREVRRRFGSRAPRCVGVFVDEPVERVRSALDRAGLDLAQLHGAEPPSDLETLARPAFKALRPRTRQEAKAPVAAYCRPGPDRSLPQLLLDAYHPGLYGGTGLTADWTLAAGLARQARLLLAGGLGPENVGLAMAQVRPWGVDVSSGVERSPGVKDIARVRAFIEAVRAADAGAR